jgi:hypothetical protein
METFNAQHSTPNAQGKQRQERPAGTQGSRAGHIAAAGLRTAAIHCDEHGLFANCTAAGLARCNIRGNGHPNRPAMPELPVARCTLNGKGRKQLQT